jgi:GTP:adenosylcobinamide-phosphate guanylyltransferase
VKYTAVVLAGSRPGRDPFADQFGADLKALIPVCGEPMVRRPVRALLASKSIGNVIVLAQDPDRIAAAIRPDARVRIAVSEGSIAQTMLRLCEDQAIEWPLLVTTADHALLDRAVIDEFCAEGEGADVAIGVVERSLLLRRFPQSRRTWLKFRGGAFTGANLFALRSPKVAKAIELWADGEQRRKKGWQLVSLLGPTVLLGTVLRLLSIDNVLDRVGQRLDLTMKAVRLTNPLAGVDVDKPEDHALAQSVIEGRA